MDGKDKKAMLVWDIDDTLYDRALPITEACEEATGFSIRDRRDFYRRFQVHSNEVFYEVERGALSLEDSRVLRITRTLAELGWSITPRQARLFQRLYLERQRAIRLSPGMEDLMEGCQRAGIPMAVLTNGPYDHQREKYKALGLERWIPEERLCISQELGSAKPDPACFLAAQKRLGREAGDCLLVGDSLISDVQGALRAGWRAIWYCPQGPREGEDFSPMAREEGELWVLIKRMLLQEG